MAIIARKSPSQFSPAPEGLYQGVCCDVWEPFPMENTFSPGEVRDVTRICWQLDVIDEKNGKPFEVSQIYNLSLHEKSNLCKHLEAWRGRKFTKEEKQGFDLEKLLGANCQIQVVHNIKDGGEVYANVQAIVPIGKNTKKIRVADGYVRHKDREQKRGDAHEAAAGTTAAEDSEVPF